MGWEAIFHDGETHMELVLAIAPCSTDLAAAHSTLPPRFSRELPGAPQRPEGRMQWLGKEASGMRGF